MTEPSTIADRLRGLAARLDAVTHKQLFGFTMLWVVCGGLLLQLVILPFVIPAAHWGHGLIKDLDNIWYHLLAIEQSDKIREHGWGAWELRPGNGQFPAGLASALYAVTYREPWVVLPVNGAVFALAVTAIAGVLELIVKSRSTAIASLLPFFVFPSFVPIWGQLQKDVFAGSGLALVLFSVLLASTRDRQTLVPLPVLLASAAGGMALVWLVRPYGMVIVGVGAMIAAVFLMMSNRCHRIRVLAVMGVVSAAMVSVAPPVQMRTLPSAAPVTPQPAQPVPPNESVEPLPPAPVGPSVSWFQRLRSINWPAPRLPQLRRIDAELPLYAGCAPAPTRDFSDRLLFSLCMVREGFIGDARRTNATSGYDYQIRMRSTEDFIAYAPRAVGFTLVEPAPYRWGSERTPVGRLGSFFVPLEMLVAYSCFFLALVFGGRHLARPEVWAVLVFCLLYGVTFAYVTPQLGTLYRMRAFAFSIIVSTALSVFLLAVRKLDVNRNLAVDRG